MVSRITISERNRRLNWIRLATKKHPEIETDELIRQVASEFRVTLRKASEDVRIVLWENINEN